MTRRLSVLDIINTDRSASELLDHRVAQVNADGRYDNAICCPDGDHVERLRTVGHRVHVVDVPRGLSPGRLAVATWRTFRLLRCEQFDVLHSHASVVGVVARVAAFCARTPVVIHQVHGFHHHEHMSPARRWAFATAERCMAWLTDRLLFQLPSDLDECLRRRIAPRRKLVLIGNGVQLDTFRETPDPENDPAHIVCVGRLEPVKNPQMALDAARLLKERGVAFRLRLVGDGALRGSLESWVRSAGLEAEVSFLGYRDDVAELTRSANICLLTSIKEGMPRAIIEAAACGRPMVATDVAGSRDTLLDGKTGFLVPLHDPVALADRLERLIREPALRRRMGQAAAAHAREHFDERRVTERIIGVYDEALREARRGVALESQAE